jgi:hypothetical protein
VAGARRPGRAAGNTGTRSRLGSKPSPRDAPLIALAASMDATGSVVRAERPFEPFVAIVRGGNGCAARASVHLSGQGLPGYIDPRHAGDTTGSGLVWLGRDAPVVRPETPAREAVWVRKPSPRDARLIGLAASMDATRNVIRAQRPFEPFVAIVRGGNGCAICAFVPSSGATRPSYIRAAALRPSVPRAGRAGGA